MNTLILIHEFEYVTRKMGLNAKLANFVVRYFEIGKKALKKMFTNSIHYAIFSHLPNSPSAICFSDNYVIFVYQIGEGYGVYLFGINSDGKIFVNKLPNNVIAENLSNMQKIAQLLAPNDKQINIHRLEDEDVYKMLGYQIDLEKMPEKVIPVYTKEEANSNKTMPLLRRAYLDYRVQGDLIMTIWDVNDYHEGLRGEIRARIERILTNIALERIFLALQDASIGASFGDNSLTITGISRDLSRVEINEMLEKLAEYILASVDFSDIGARIYINVLDDFSSRQDQETPRLEIWIMQDRGIFGSRYIPIRIDVRPNMPLVAKYTDEVIKGLKLEKEWRIARMGRHLVRYYGYPNRFTISARLINDNEYLIPIELRTHYISEGEIYFLHPEHNQIKVKVLEDVSARFRSTNVDQEFENRLNYYALKQLAQFMELRKFYKLA
jgi:hypothetical protein